MSGHAGFAPIGGNLPPINVSQIQPGAGNVAVSQNPPQPEPEAVEPQNPPTARSVAQKLDAMLLRAAGLSSRTVDEKKLKAVMDEAGLGRAERKALAEAAAKAQKAMQTVSKYTGRQIGGAFAADANGGFDWKGGSVAKAVRAAIDAQAELSELLHNLANKKGVTGDLFETISEMALRCDRRQSEITTLAMQLAEAVAAPGADPSVAERLDQRLSQMLPRQALSMHGNVEAVEKLKNELQPLADRLEAFAAKPNASLTAEEFTGYAAEVADAARAVERMAKDGFPTPDGGRLMPDRDFANALLHLAKSARKTLENARKNVGDVILKDFAAKHIGMPKGLPITSQRNINTISGEAPALAKAIRLRLDLHRTILEYAANPTADAKSALENILSEYMALDFRDIKDDISRVLSSYGDKMSAPEWEALAAAFSAKPKSMHSQVAHFLQMAKNVSRTMEPQQFLSTTSACALVEGKLAFSTLVEARIHGMADKDVDPALDDSNLASHKTLGSGAVNTVTLVTYKDGSQRVFKPEAPGRQSMENLLLSKDYAAEQQVAQLNLATQSTADVLGLGDVAPKCSVGVHDGEYGLFMEKAPGVEAKNLTGGRKVPEGSLTSNEIRKLPDDRHAEVVGGLMRGSNRLEWLDLITGQGDRHDSNYMVDVKPDGSVSVKGIDNDQCFPSYRTGIRTYTLKGSDAARFLEECEDLVKLYPKAMRDDVRKRIMGDPGLKRNQDGEIVIDTTKFQSGELHYIARCAIGMHGDALPNYIDEDLYEKLVALKAGEKREAWIADISARLPADAVAAAVNRLDEAIAHAEKLAGQGMVVSKADFARRDVQKRLLAPELNAPDLFPSGAGFTLSGNSQVVRRANRQVKSFFVRDLLKNVVKKDWFK